MTKKKKSFEELHLDNPEKSEDDGSWIPQVHSGDIQTFESDSQDEPVEKKPHNKFGKFKNPRENK